MGKEAELIQCLYLGLFFGFLRRRATGSWREGTPVRKTSPKQTVPRHVKGGRGRGEVVRIFYVDRRSPRVRRDTGVGSKRLPIRVSEFGVSTTEPLGR